MKQPPPWLQGRAHASRRGGALALALIIVLAVAALSAGLLQLSSATARRQAAATNRKLAFYAAEAGLAEAYAGLLVGKSGNVGTASVPAVFGQGLFWVEATENPQDETVTLRSTGMVGDGRAVLSVVAARGEENVASLGIFSDAALDLQPGALVDGYDSELGPYQPPTEATVSMPASKPTRLGRVGSNALVQATGTVTLPTTVDGDLVPGPSSQVVLKGQVQVTGATTPARSVVPLPPVELPTTPLAPGVAHGSGVPLVLLPGESGMEFLTVRSGSQAVLQGPATLVFGRLVVEPGGDLLFDTSGGVVNVYVRDAMDLQVGSTVGTTTNDASLAAVLVEGSTASPVQLAAQGAFHGVVYGPEADVVVRQDFELFGALIGRDVQLVGPVKLHFDRFLEDLSVETVLPKLISWRIEELSTPKDMGRSTSPFQYLGVAKEDLPSPAEAHADQPITIDYLDLSGNPRSYAGLESAFDWSQVLRVTELYRDGELVPDIAATKEPELSPLIAALADPNAVSRDLKNMINAASPVTDDVLAAAIARKPRMDPQDLTSVLQTNAPLTEPVLSDAVRFGPLPSADLTAVLLTNSPLSASVMSDVLNRVPPLDPADLATVLAAQ